MAVPIYEIVVVSPEVYAIRNRLANLLVENKQGHVVYHASKEAAIQALRRLDIAYARHLRHLRQYKPTKNRTKKPQKTA